MHIVDRIIVAGVEFAVSGRMRMHAREMHPHPSYWSQHVQSTCPKSVTQRDVARHSEGGDPTSEDEERRSRSAHAFEMDEVTIRRCINSDLIWPRKRWRAGKVDGDHLRPVWENRKLLVREILSEIRQRAAQQTAILKDGLEEEPRSSAA